MWGHGEICNTPNFSSIRKPFPRNIYLNKIPLTMDDLIPNFAHVLK